jgi:hypothetical protein
MRLITAAFFAFLLSAGPLGLLQVVAWTGMVVDYSSRYGLTEGISRTFDGKHPCSMCETITQTRKDDTSSKSTTSLQANKITYLLAVVISVPRQDASQAPQVYFASQSYFDGHITQPALPPPRILAA